MAPPTAGLDADPNLDGRNVEFVAPVNLLMAMATYARQTGSYVIAEGIEDQDTLDFLGAIGDRDIQVEYIIQGGQGFGLGRPGPRLVLRRDAEVAGARSGLTGRLAGWTFPRLTSSSSGG